MGEQSRCPGIPAVPLKRPYQCADNMNEPRLLWGILMGHCAGTVVSDGQPKRVGGAHKGRAPARRLARRPGPCHRPEACPPPAVSGHSGRWAKTWRCHDKSLAPLQTRRLAAVHKAGWRCAQVAPLAIRGEPNLTRCQPPRVPLGRKAGRLRRPSRPRCPWRLPQASQRNAP